MNIDSQVFEQYPKLRRMVGNFGDKLNKVRPINHKFEKWMEHDTDEVTVKAWAIIDHEGWRRDLIPLEVESNELFLFSRTIMLEGPLVGCTGSAIGCVIYVPFMGFVVCPFSKEPTSITEGSESLCLTYTLEYCGPELEPYLPSEDFDC